MQTTFLRILFTLAILIGLAAAPTAQTFRWEAGRTDAAERAQRAIERALENAERSIERVQRNAQRAAERAARLANQNADRIRRQVERDVNARVRAQVRSEIRASMPRIRVIRPIRPNRPGPYFYHWDSAMQNFGDDPCRTRRGGDYEEFCDVRTESMAAGPLTVDAGPNGGIAVEGWDRSDIKVEAVVHAHADNESRARQLAQEVRVLVGNGRVTAEGPTRLRDEWWSVSYRINVPHKNDLDLNANNGGISIKNVAGNMKFDTSNGGVTLADLGGSVRGSTNNGGLTVMLSGQRWDGEGIDVQTTNGGVTLSIPDNYNAQLETRTVNGGVSVNYPLTITGELSTRRGISTTIGSGGPTVRVRTTNGGLKIGRR